MELNAERIDKLGPVLGQCARQFLRQASAVAGLDRDDLVQEGWLKVQKMPEPPADCRNLSSWVSLAVRRHFISMVGKPRIAPIFCADLAAVDAPEDVVSDSTAAMVSTVHTALEKLPEKAREALTARYGIETGLPAETKEVAAQIGIPRRRMQGRIRCGLAQLRRNLNAD